MKSTQQNSAAGGKARMADIQSLFGMTPRAIRYYEIIGLIEATRTGTNARVFDARARERLRWIARLRAAGVSLEGIREVVELDADAEGRALQAPVALTKLAELADRLRTELEQVESATRELEQELVTNRRPRLAEVETVSAPRFRPVLRKFA